MSRMLRMFPRKRRGSASLPRLQFAAIAVVPMPRKGSSLLMSTMRANRWIGRQECSSRCVCSEPG